MAPSHCFSGSITGGIRLFYWEAYLFLSKFPEGDIDALAQVFSTPGVLAGMPGDARDTVLNRE